MRSPDPRARGDSVRHGWVRLSIWLGLSSLYLFFSLAVLLVGYHLGIKPGIDLNRQQHARHVSTLAFESLYSLMNAGDGRAHLQSAALRLESSAPGISIQFARGPRVVEQFGELRDSRVLKESRSDIRAALRSGQPQERVADGELRGAYPAVFQTHCANCHEQAVAGEVAGVVAVTYRYQQGDSEAAQNMLPLAIFLLLAAPGVLLISYRITRRQD